MNFVNSKFLKGTVINFRIFFYYNLLSAKLLKFHFIPFVIIFFGITSGLRAQNQLANKQFMVDIRFTKILDGSYAGNNLKTSDIQGTPYLNDKFEPGKIVTPEDSVFGNIELRYNAFTDNLEFKKGENIFNIASKNIVKKAEFGGKMFGCRSYEANGGNILYGFFEILTEGKTTLLARYKIKFMEKEVAKPYSDAKPARFEDMEKQYFFMSEGNPAKLIPNKKRLLKIFGTKSDEMETYISRNKLSVKEDDSLIKIINHFNTL